MLHPQIDFLEPRRMLAGNPLDPTTEFFARPGIHYANPLDENVPFYTSSPTGLSPTQIRQAYGLNNIMWGSITGDGAGQTIAVVNAYDNPKFVSSSSASYNTSDLYYFNNHFGLPQFGTPGGPTFTKVNQSGGTSYPAANSGWAGEIALDVEWAHVIAPKANIILVEANDASTVSLIQNAVNWARNQPGVTAISMSFGINGGFAGETAYDSYFTTPAGHPGVSFFAATGDLGNPGGYPAESPNVVAVGGTSLTTLGNNWQNETAWGNGANSTNPNYGGSGGGISAYQSKPSYQSAVTQSATMRTIPDIAFVANPNTGVPVYHSYGGGNSTPWVQVGGTSLSSPCWAGIAAIMNQGRAVAGAGSLDGRTQLLPMLYSLPASDYHDIVSGSINNGISATVGYDLVTGIGSPKANLLVPDLVGPGVPDLTALSDSGISDTDNLTNLSLPTFTGIATTGATVQIYADGVLVGSGVSGSNNTYSITLTTPISDGARTIVSKIASVSSSSLVITVDTAAPQLSNITVNLPASESIDFYFSKSVNNATLSPGKFILTNLTTPGLVDSNALTVAYDGLTNRARITWPALGGTLADGNYTATLAPGVTDAAGNEVSGIVPVSFFFLNGDATGDRFVDMQDFNLLAGNFGQAAGFAEGNFDYTGTVDSTDFAILVAQFGKRLAAPASATTVLARSSSPFGSRAVELETPPDLLAPDATLAQAI